MNGSSDDEAERPDQEQRKVQNIDRDYSLENEFMAADGVAKEEQSRPTTYDEMNRYGKMVGELVMAKHRRGGGQDNDVQYLSMLKRIMQSALQYCPLEDVKSLSTFCNSLSVEKLEKERGKKLGTKTKAQKTKTSLSRHGVIDTSDKKRPIGRVIAQMDYDDEWSGFVRLHKKLNFIKDVILELWNESPHGFLYWITKLILLYYKYKSILFKFV